MPSDELSLEREVSVSTLAETTLFTWPSPQDYNEAVQMPDYTFADEELKSGRPELTSLGLPKVATGNFASVYKLRCAKSEWALRCFLHPVVDQEQRYEQIHSALSEMDSKYFVDFAYMRQGVRVNSRWYPALKMEWADGVPLHIFVARNLENPSELIRVAESLKKLTLEFQEHGIAHGDLQHGNILVSSANLRVVDYDAVYVPALEGNSSSELGHRNYQHPNRAAQDFNGQLDNFSAWVIYVSLICLAHDPGLWQLLDGGDECLIFRQRDFAKPESSRAFRICENSANETIRLHARFLRSLISLSFEQIPSLSAPVEVAIDLPPLVTNRRNQLVNTRGPGWIPAALFCLFLVFAVAANDVLTKTAPEEPPAKTEERVPRSNLSELTERAIAAQRSGHYFDAAELYKQAIEDLNKSAIKHPREIAECWHQMVHCQYEVDRPQAAKSLARAQKLYGCKYFSDSHFAHDSWMPIPGGQLADSYWSD